MAVATTGSKISLSPEIEQQAHERIISELQRLDTNRRRRSDLIPKKKTVRRLQEVASDIERAQVLPRGTIFGLQKLDNTDHFFVRHTTERSPYIPELKRRFEVLTASGERILLAVEETSCLTNAFSYSSLRDFDYRFLDPNNGIEAFRVSSRSRVLSILGTVLSVLKENRVLGKITQTGQYGSTVFKFFSVGGRLMYVIKPFQDYVIGPRPSFFQRINASDDIDIPFPSEFNIFSADESVLVGKITGNWNIHETVGPISAEEISDSDTDESTSEEDGSSSEEIDDSVSSSSSDEEEGPSVSNVSDRSASIALSQIDNRRLVQGRAQSSVVPFQHAMGHDAAGILILDATRMRKYRHSSHKKKFNYERYQSFLETVDRRIENWEWYFEGENFGAEFSRDLGSISRAMILAVLIIQYFRIHFDRYHRRKSTRILFRTRFKKWCIISAMIWIVAILVIILDIYRDRTPS